MFTHAVPSLRSTRRISRKTESIFSKYSWGVLSTPICPTTPELRSLQYGGLVTTQCTESSGSSRNRSSTSPCKMRQSFIINRVPTISSSLRLSSIQRHAARATHACIAHGTFGMYAVQDAIACRSCISSFSHAISLKTKRPWNKTCNVEHAAALSVRAYSRIASSNARSRCMLSLHVSLTQETSSISAGRCQFCPFYFHAGMYSDVSWRRYAWPILRYYFQHPLARYKVRIPRSSPDWHSLPLSAHRLSLFVRISKSARLSVSRATNWPSTHLA